MTAPTPEAIAKLPKWAREHIGRLVRERDDARRTLAEYHDSQTPSNIWTSGISLTSRRYIQGDRIEFGEPTGTFYDFSAYYNGGQLQVMGVRGMIVRPHSSNVITCQIDRD